MLLVFLLAKATVLAQNWAQTGAPTLNWVSVAISADGQFIAAATGWPDGRIYASTNGGVAWSDVNAPGFRWSSVACSADGGKLFAVQGPNTVLISTNAGVDWEITTAPASPLTLISSSADGARLVVAGYIAPSPSVLCFSTNSGANWFQAVGPVMSWRALAGSADGSTFLASASAFGAPDGVFISRDSGVTWADTDLQNAQWQSVASSASAETLYAAGDEVFISADRGSNWVTTGQPTSPTLPTGLSGTFLACSSDGSKVVAASNPAFPFSSGGVFRSQDFGQTWSSNSAPAINIGGIASSADGHKLVLVAGGISPEVGGVFISESTPAPRLQIALSRTVLILSWMVPSIPMKLQQSAALPEPDWSDVEVEPLLRTSDLHYEVRLPLPTTSMIYRLASEQK